ncbi:hypothetical protein K474DRAFT_1633728 [Panus rudis PR-1116 ss-1]|nr:hypothetical protein K474DRAFT_1633728 [Panus rudis PR-1116 ss-1]
MNVVREINKINEQELNLGISGSWHDDYKDSAYIFVGGLHQDLTEGDVITIFSQYGEVMDVNLPRDKNTGKHKGFGFLMYEDQRSTILAVDNLNGAKVLERTLRVDHVKNYKQPKTKGEDGEWQEPEEQSLNAKPPMVIDDGAMSDSSGSSGPDIDPEDPMRDYLIAKWKEEKAAKKSKKKSKKHKDETPEERRARKERKKEKKLKKAAGKSAGMKAVEELLAELDGQGANQRRRRSPDHSRTPSRSRSPRRNHRDRTPEQRRYHSRSRTPPRYAVRSPTPEQRDRETRTRNDGHDRYGSRSYDRDSLSRKRREYD